MTIRLPKSIILVNQTTGPLFSEVVRTFHREGYGVTLLAGTVDAGKVPLPEGIQVLQGPPYQRHSAISRLRTWWAFTRWCKRQLRQLPSDIPIFFVTNPPFAPLLAIRLPNPFGVLVYDLYPDVLQQQGYLSRHHPVYRWWAKRNRRVFARAKVIFTLSEGMAKAIGQYLNDSALMPIVIPNWGDTEHIRPIAKRYNPFRQQVMQSGDQLCVLYAGNMGITHPFGVVLETAAQMRHLPIRWVLVGDGPQKGWIQDEVSQRALENVTLLPFQPYEQLSEILSAPDLGLVLLDAAATHASVPSKTYNLLAAGTPLLALTHPDSEVAALVDKHGLGIHVTPDSPLAIAQLLLELLADSSIIQQWVNAALAASQHFTPANATAYVTGWQEQFG